LAEPEQPQIQAPEQLVSRCLKTLWAEFEQRSEPQGGKCK